MSTVLDTCRRAAAVKHTIGALSTPAKNRVLLAIADAVDRRFGNSVLHDCRTAVDGGRIHEGLLCGDDRTYKDEAASATIHIGTVYMGGVSCIVRNLFCNVQTVGNGLV